MKRSKAIGTTVLALFTLISCGAPEDWFPCHHEVTFRRGGATAPESVVPVDARSLVMFQVQTRVKGHAEPVTIDGLTFRASGTGDDREDIAGVSLHVDRNGDGALDGGDRLLARVMKRRRGEGG